MPGLIRNEFTRIIQRTFPSQPRQAYIQYKVHPQHIIIQILDYPWHSQVAMLIIRMFNVNEVFDLLVYEA